MRTLTVMALVGFALPVAGVEPPEGWRLPTSQELAHEPLRLDSATRFAEALADFDGDEGFDTALLLKTTRLSGEGLLVKLSLRSEEHWLVLDEIDWGEEHASVNLVMGIDVLAPGVYKTACGKGYRDCAPEEPAELKLALPGLLYFKFESASSIFYWDEGSHGFKRVWISD